MAMSVRSRIRLLGFVLVVGAATSTCVSHRPEGVGPAIPTVTCGFDVGRMKGRDGGGKFEVRGARERPQFVVNFNGHSGRASLRKRDGFWPEISDLRVSGDRDTLLFVSLIPEGFGELQVH